MPIYLAVFSRCDVVSVLELTDETGSELVHTHEGGDLICARFPATNQEDAHARAAQIGLMHRMALAENLPVLPGVVEG